MSHITGTEPVTSSPESLFGWPVLSLFSGAGGLDLGFRLAGFSPRLAIDFSPAAVQTYRANHSQAEISQLDISQVSATDILDLWRDSAATDGPVGIIGGPPCQAFSNANVHQSPSDPRRDLLAKYAAIVGAFASSYQLEFFVFENVPGLANKQHRPYFDHFKEMCDDAGFEVSKKVIDAGRFGVPQHRKRLIVAGVNRQRFPGVHIELPDGDKVAPPVSTVLKDLPEPSYCSRKPVKEPNQLHPNHVAMVPRSRRFKDGSLRPGDKRGLSFKVLDWNSPSYTVAYGHNEVHVHPGCHRRLSVFEAMLLQGFPEEYELSGTFSQQVQLVSDAVPPPLGEGIASAIALTLSYSKGDDIPVPASIQTSYL